LLLHEKKNTRGLINNLYMVLQVEGKGGSGRRLLQNNNDEGERVLPSPEYWLIRYLQEKDGEGGCDGLPLLCLETNDNMGGYGMFFTFVAT